LGQGIGRTHSSSAQRNEPILIASEIDIESHTSTRAHNPYLNKFAQTRDKQADTILEVAERYKVKNRAAAYKDFVNNFSMDVSQELACAYSGLKENHPMVHSKH
jgi:hypothetical protein